MSNSLDPKSRFSSRVADYVKYRPSYPKAFVDWLIEQAALIEHSVIADVGSGTGISAKLFLDRGMSVIGIETNQEMRSAAEDLLLGYPKFTSIAASAEATTLPDSSVEIVMAGQAFHWFDRDAFRTESKRILKPGGKVALFWNERLIDATPFLREYEELIKRFATDYSKVDHRRMDDKVIESFYANKPIIATFPNVQVLDFDGLQGRLMSSSYVPAAKDPATAQMLNELRKLYEVHAVDDRIELLYETKVYLSDL